MTVPPRMSDRLQELLRQRALVEEHLAWLDRQIAEATPDRAAPPPPPPVAPRYTLKPAASSAPAPQGYLASQAASIARHAAAPVAPPAPRDENPAVATAADAILEEYRVSPDSLKTDVRKGCFLYFFVALAVVGLVVVGLYFLISHR